MRQLTIFYLTILLLAPIGVTSSDSDILIDSGDSLFEIYEYENSITYYNQSLASDSTSAETYWKLAGSLNLLAELQPEENQLELYEKAAEAAEKAVALDSLQPEGHFQLAWAIGKIALFKGVFKSIGLAKRVKKEAEIALELNPNHDGAYHILGRWHREVSKKSKIFRVPLGLGEADKEKGLPLLGKAVEIEPGKVNHRLEYAISLLDSGYEKQAKEQFEYCLDLTASGPLDIKYQKQAKEYLANLE